MCPPGIDQTTRTAQRWQIIAPRLRTIQPLERPASWRNTLHTYLFNHALALDLWAALARPPSRPTAPRPRSAAEPRAGPSQPLSALEALPSELLHMITSAPELAEPDLVALGLASPCLWPYALHRAAARARAAAAPLAGAELACTGTWLTDMPAPFAAAGLYDDTQPWGSLGLGRGGRGRGMCPARRFNWDAVSGYEKLGAPPAEAWATAWDERCAWAEERFGRRRASALGAELRCAVAGPGTVPGAADERWVLRDLDARAYVRCRPGPGTAPEGPSALRARLMNIHPEKDEASETSEDEEELAEAKALPEKRGLVDHVDAAGMTVDDVLLLRICWTALDDDERDVSMDFMRGAWAGHRFDIVPWAEAAVGAGWTDGTDDVVRQAWRVADARGDRLEASGRRCDVRERESYAPPARDATRTL